MGNNCCANRTLNTSTIDLPESVKKVYNSKHERKVRIIQRTWKSYKCKKRERELILAKTKLLENKITELGRYVDMKYLNAKISKKILEIEKTLPSYIGQPNENEYLKKDRISREPFEYKLDRSIFYGTWNQDGLRHGYGYLVRENGAKLEGLWQDGELFKGRIFDNSGNYYEGNIKNMEPLGEGIYVGVNGLKYQGNWKNGTYNDYGVFTLPDRTVYKGNFLNGLFEGKGSITWPNGMMYEGNFNNNSISGMGKMTTREGDIYTGQWENNLPHGQGLYEWKRHECKYRGEYKFGRKDGMGRYDFPDGEFYEGNWFNDRPHGAGKYNNLNNKEVNGTWRYGTLIECSSPTETSRKSGFMSEFWKKDNNILQNMSYTKNLGSNQIYNGNFNDLVKI